MITHDIDLTSKIRLHILWQEDEYADLSYLGLLSNDFTLNGSAMAFNRSMSYVIDNITKLIFHPSRFPEIRGPVVFEYFIPANAPQKAWRDMTREEHDSLIDTWRQFESFGVTWQMYACRVEVIYDGIVIGSSALTNIEGLGGDEFLLERERELVQEALREAIAWGRRHFSALSYAQLIVAPIHYGLLAKAQVADAPKQKPCRYCLDGANDDPAPGLRYVGSLPDPDGGRWHIFNGYLCENHYNLLVEDGARLYPYEQRRRK